jgi:hypothetical protein
VTGVQTCALPIYPPAYTGDLNFTDEIDISINDNSDIVTSHLFTFFTTDFFSYNRFQKTKSLSSVVLTPSPDAESYKKTFYMDGIIAEKVFCNLNYYNTNINFQNIGKELLFSAGKNLFGIDNNFNNSYNLYWRDLLLKSSDYTLSDGHIDIKNITENSTYPMIYDTTSANLSPLHVSFSFATGNYPRGTAICFSGPDLARSLIRQSKRNFYETSSYHIAHSKMDRITFTPLNSIYRDTDDYWDTSFRPIETPSIAI